MGTATDCSLVATWHACFYNIGTDTSHTRPFRISIYGSLLVVSTTKISDSCWPLWLLPLILVNRTIFYFYDGATQKMDDNARKVGQLAWLYRE